jgi:D-serine deaminase-like pyridoxal phosphate-dependent protein
VGGSDAAHYLFWNGCRMKLHDLATPALVLDEAIMQANIERMAAHAAELGVPLRPHGKTPKSVEIGCRLTADAACGLTVSTLKEAETYFARGIRDLFYAVPFAAGKTARALNLIAHGAALKCATDNLAVARATADAAATCGGRLPLAVEIDVDGYRTGIPLGENLIELVRFISKAPSLSFAGLMSYGGASYGCRSVAETQALAEKHRVALLEAQSMLGKIGIATPMLSFGSTPAVMHAKSMQGMSELRCGIYVFQDLFQAAIGACRIEDLALSVLCTVIGMSRAHNRVVIDAGGLALSKDRSTAATDTDAGYGLVCDVQGRLLEDLFVPTVSQEIGLLTSCSGRPLDFARLVPGTKLRILPNHADMTAAAYDLYHVVRGDERVQAVWTRVNGW